MPFTQAIDVNIGFNVSVSASQSEIESHLQDENSQIASKIASISDGYALRSDLQLTGITNVEVTRPAGIGGSEAEVKAPIENPDVLKGITVPGVRFEIYVDVYDVRLFTGEIIKATENEEGLVTITAQDARRDLMSYTVRLDTPPSGIPSTKIIQNLLIEDGPFEDDEVRLGYESSGSGSDSEITDSLTNFLSSSPTDYEGKNDPVNVRLNTGNGARPTLYKVIKDIAEVQHAYAYIDEYNRFNFQPIPAVNVWEPEYIISLNAGSSDSTTDRVIVEAPRTDVMGGTFGHQYANSKSTRSEAKSESGSNEKAKLLKHQNLTSVEAADNAAVDSFVGSELSTESGTVKAVGFPVPTPFDQLELTNLPEHTSLPEGNYTITEITHKISADSGYTTEAKVGKDLESIYESIISNDQAKSTVDDLREEGYWEKLGYLTDIHGGEATKFDKWFASKDWGILETISDPFNQREDPEWLDETFDLDGSNNNNSEDNDE